MNVPVLPLLVLAAMSQPVLGQFVPPPEPPSRNSARNTDSEAFPLPDQAIAPLTRAFDSTVENPDWKIARLMAELSFLAYEDSIPSVQNRLRLYDLSLVEFVTVDNHHFITAWDQTNDVLVIAFRGTDIAQLADVWTDLDYGNINTRIGELHKGFWDAADAVHRSVVAAIERRKRPRHLWLTGHSLGGAIATVEMRRLESEGYVIGGLVTFGQPRVGDKQFTERMNAAMGNRILRFINEDDVVASLPPRGFIAGIFVPPYYSCGEVIQFLDGTLNRSGGVQAVARLAIDDVFAEPLPPTGEPAILPPLTPQGAIPPDPPPLTVDEFQLLKQVLREGDHQPNVTAQQYGGPLDWGRDLLRRAGNHPMHLYIQQIERFAAEGK